MTDPVARHSGIPTRLFRHIPPGQFWRYLLVGAWNTLFGYAVYALFTAILTPHVRFGYVLASFLASMVNITVAFLGYKWFVFRTKGNYLQEWIRCVMVYSTIILLSMLLLPPMVFAVARLAHQPRGAPYIAGLLVTGLGVVLSFIGHKTISFRQAIEKADEAS